MGSAKQRKMERDGATLTRALAKTRRGEDHPECFGLLRLAEKVKQSGLFCFQTFQERKSLETLSKVVVSATET